MILKEKKRRQSFKNSEVSQLLYKQLYKNSSFNFKRRISLKFAKKNKNNNDIFRTKCVNSCLITGRSRGVVSRRFKMARYTFRIFALNGKIPGIVKGI